MSGENTQRLIVNGLGSRLDFTYLLGVIAAVNLYPSAAGLSHIFHGWIPHAQAEVLVLQGLGVALPWTVEYDKYNSGSLVPEEVSPGMMTRCSSATVFPASWTMRLISYWVA